MFGIGSGEILVIIIVALLVLGPEKLPSAARILGKAMGDLRRMSTEFHRELNSEVEPGARSNDPVMHPEISTPPQNAPKLSDSAARTPAKAHSDDTKESREP